MVATNLAADVAAARFSSQASEPGRGSRHRTLSDGSGAVVTSKVGDDGRPVERAIYLGDVQPGDAGGESVDRELDAALVRRDTGWSVRRAVRAVGTGGW